MRYHIVSGRIGALVLALAIVGALTAAALRVVPHALVRALTCLPTGMGVTTAALVNPVGVVSGTIDATGCTFGIFFDASHSGTVLGAVLFGASSDGIVSQGSSITVQGSVIEHVGGQALNIAGSTTVAISGNSLSHYGAGAAGILAAVSSIPGSSILIARNKMSAASADDTGINLSGGGSVTVTGNVVTGTTNGMLVSSPGSTTLTVTGNVVNGNSLGSGISALGPATVTGNAVTENLSGITVIDTGMTDVDVARNAVRNGQLGIEVVGTSGQVTANSVCVAPGGQPLNTPGSGLTVSGNMTDTTCS